MKISMTVAIKPVGIITCLCILLFGHCESVSYQKVGIDEESLNELRTVQRKLKPLESTADLDINDHFRTLKKEVNIFFSLSLTFPQRSSINHPLFS